MPSLLAVSGLHHFLIREGLRMLLDEWGYQSIVAADSSQAEEAAAALEGQVDLILSDLHLGEGEDGLDAIDNVPNKMLLLVLCREKKLPVITCGGAGAGPVAAFKSTAGGGNGAVDVGGFAGHRIRHQDQRRRAGAGR